MKMSRSKYWKRIWFFCFLSFIILLNNANFYEQKGAHADGIGVTINDVKLSSIIKVEHNFEITTYFFSDKIRDVEYSIDIKKNTNTGYSTYRFYEGQWTEYLHYGNQSIKKTISVDKSVEPGSYHAWININQEYPDFVHDGVEIDFRIYEKDFEAPIPVPKLICPNEGIINRSITFDASQTTIGKDSYITGYKYNFGDGETTDWIFIQSTEHTYIKLGTYSVTLQVKTNFDIIKSTSKTIVVRRPKITVNVQLSNDLVNVDEKISIDASESYDENGTMIILYFFDFGDGQNSGWINKSKVEHGYSNEGTYKIKIRVKNVNGTVSEWYIVKIVIMSNLIYWGCFSLVLIIGIIVIIVAITLYLKGGFRKDKKSNRTHQNMSQQQYTMQQYYQHPQHHQQYQPPPPQYPPQQPPQYPPQY